MNGITIERAENGWIITHSYGRKEVFTDLSRMLLEVYHCTADWNINDRIEIHRANDGEGVKSVSATKEEC